MRLIDEYSRKGVAVTIAKTADYRVKIPGAVNMIQQDLAYGVGKIAAEMTISNPSPGSYPDELYETLPDDWFRKIRVMLQRQDTYWVPFYNYRITPTDFVYCTAEGGDILVSYYRRPTAIAVVDPISPTATELAQTIDVIPEAEYIMPLGVAGMILAGDDNNQSVHFLNLYESRKYMIPQPDSDLGFSEIPNVNGW